MSLFKKIAARLRRYEAIPSRLDTLQEAVGRIEASLQQQVAAPVNFASLEFKVYSQWGEDGIINYLVSRIEIPNRVFVEFGVENYTEANTLFLLKHRYWRGLVIDGSPDNIESIRRGNVFWKFDLNAACAFVTRDNINELIVRNGISGDIGLLSVDIDGNDYWVWEAITAVSPRIVIAEYNSLFGPSAKVSIPYDPTFTRGNSQVSKLFYGASIAALNHLAESKGYALVAGNSAGNNAFFVRRDCLGDLAPVLPEQAYVPQPFRESRGDDGGVRLLTFAERRAAIERLPLVDVTSSKHVCLAELS